MIILNGNYIAEKKLHTLKKNIYNFQIKPQMSIIQIGDIFESNKYIAIKLKKANYIGIKIKHIKLSKTINQNELIKIIKKECSETDGLIVQLPLPSNLEKQKILNAVDFKKDIDGLSDLNNKLLYKNKKSIFPATAKAIISLLSFYKITINNRNISIIGESNLVGRPTKELLKRLGANVNSFNIKTGIKGTEKSDILIVAAGSPGLVKSENIKNGAIIIDVGTSSVGKSNKIFGDVDYESIKDKAFAISPIIGGVGPLTVASLFENLVEIYTEKLFKNK